MDKSIQQTTREIANLKKDLFLKMPASQALNIMQQIAKEWQLKPMLKNKDWEICKKIINNSIINN